jgi:hypothetical protein
VRGEKDINYDNLYNHFLENYEPNDILITDSNDFRNYVRSHHSSAFVFDHDVCHIGYHHDTEHMPGICNTLVEFFLCTEASKLKTFSIYGWVSGFIYPIHKIYDIPLQSHVNLII